MKQSISIAICDDENKCINILEQHLLEFKKIYSNIAWDIYYSAEDFFGNMGNLQYDIIITDIEMKGINGVELANKIRELDDNIIIIFLTSHEEYMRECFFSTPLNFWDKPLKYEVLQKDLIRAIDKITSNNKILKIKTLDGIVRLFYKDIFYFESQNHTVIVHTNREDYRFYSSLKNISKSLDGDFAFCSQSYLVNLNFVKTIKNNCVILDNDARIVITRTFGADFKRALQKFYLKEING